MLDAWDSHFIPISTRRPKMSVRPKREEFAPKVASRSSCRDVLDTPPLTTATQHDTKGPRLVSSQPNGHQAYDRAFYQSPSSVPPLFVR